jgi:hypothetical protein
MITQNVKLLATGPDKAGKYKNLETRNKKADGSIDIYRYSVL